MTDKNYTINRDDVFVGKLSGGTNLEKILFYPDGIFDDEFIPKEIINKSLDNRTFLLQNTPHLAYNSTSSFVRSMLFVLDNNNCSNDLLYDSPHYPIFNISDDQLCLESNISFKQHVYQIGKILKYFGYPEKLKFEDILEIEEKFFGDFVLDNCELFGRYETESNTSGVETYDLLGNHRTFNKEKKDSIFPICHFDTFFHTRKTYYYQNAFIPHEIEGPIRSLKK